ncbi:MAG: hypothetical protein PSV16_14040 [Flavobacterium sp.]|nr:hypothetical protein [Flavobacterium sp.]
MEGKYTKISALVGIIALAIAIWQIYPKAKYNINGEWKMISQIEDSSLSTYKGMTVEWQMFICENANDIKGTAEKVKINNVELSAASRTSLEFEGHITDDQIVLNYQENGKKRRTSGIITAKLNGDSFEGKFSQTAANTKGRIFAERVE